MELLAAVQQMAGPTTGLNVIDKAQVGGRGGAKILGGRKAGGPSALPPKVTVNTPSPDPRPRPLYLHNLHTPCSMCESKHATGVKLWLNAQVAVNTLKVLQTLDEIADLLKVCAYGGGGNRISCVRGGSPRTPCHAHAHVHGGGAGEGRADMCEPRPQIHARNEQRGLG